MPPRHIPNASDHDVLIRIDTKVDVLQSLLQETRTALSARIDRLAQEKASYSDLDVLRKSLEDHQRTSREERNELTGKVDWTRRMIWIAMGVLGTAELLGPLLLVALFRKN